MKHIPNLFTLLNLVLGCLAIICILQNGVAIQYTAEQAQFVDMTERLMYAPVFLFLAAGVDFLDGFLARWLKAESEMGKQLDSLSDVVSFGVAPSMILYQFLRMAYASGESGIEVDGFVLLPALLPAAAAAYRLARFNVVPSDARGFVGLPSPAFGVFVATLPLIYWQTESRMVVDALLNVWVLYGLIVLLSWLMVSHVPLLSLKFSRSDRKQAYSVLFLLVAGLLLLLLLGWAASPLILVLYIVLSLISGKRMTHSSASSQ